MDMGYAEANPIKNPTKVNFITWTKISWVLIVFLLKELQFSSGQLTPVNKLNSPGSTF